MAANPIAVSARHAGGLNIDTLVMLHGNYSYGMSTQFILPLAPPSDTGVAPPALADIPIVGNLFRAHNTTTNADELIILVTPTIIIQEE